MWRYQTADEIYHHGVPGMRWGIRKMFSGSSKKGGPKRKPSQDYKTVQKLRKKKLKELSNDELKTINTRKQLEKTNQKFRKVGIGLAATATAVTVLSNYKNLKEGVGVLAKDGKAVFNGMKNIKNIRIR